MLQIRVSGWDYQPKNKSVNMFNRLFYTLLLLFLLLKNADCDILQPVGKNSLFAGGKWVEIETSSVGIHKIFFSWLKTAGFQHPEKVKIFGSRNQEISRWNNHSADNCPIQLPAFRFTDGEGNESLLFFVQGSVSWKYDPVSGQYLHSLNQSARGKSWFFLTEDTGNDLKFPVNEQPAANPDVKTTDYDDCWLWEEENFNLLESGSRWFSDLMTGGNVLKKNVQFQDRVENEKLTINVFAAGRSLSPTGMELSLNGNVLGTMTFDPIIPASDNDFASLDSFKTARVLPGTDLNFSLKYNGATADQCWLDYATVQIRRSLKYRGSPLIFRDSRTIGKGKIIEYQISGVTPGLQLWEVTNPLLPAQTYYQLTNGLLTFRAAGDSLRSFILFDPAGQYPGPTKTEEVKNADILRLEVPQYLIITPSAFLDQANRLADFHRSADAMSVAVVTVEAVFNEMSGGYPDISAIRNFIRYLCGQKNGTGGSTLKYVLLFGKGTCDPVHDPGENNPNWIPTFQSENSLDPVNSFVTDDFFGWMDSGYGNQMGHVDLGIGRIPAVSLAEASIAVDKIIHYHDVQTLGDWRNNITFIGDDEDNNIHVNDSETLASMVNQRNPEYHTPKIYLDAYSQVLTPEERYPEVNEAIRRSVQNGDLIVNYVGHASEDGLAHERVLTIKDIDAWTNKDRLPLFVTATCEFSRWDMTMKRSAGEHLYFNPAGGAIALLSATRLVYSASNFDINRSFFAHVFDRDTRGAPLRLGDLVRLVKNENGNTINALKFSLLGDPALRLNYPEYRCRNLEINNQPVSQFGGVLSPLSQVTISGQIEDGNGQKIDTFNGALSALVFDQPTGKQTLGNGGLPPFNYQVQENILFNGNVPVENGLFTYSFVVPKDVNFNKGAGLIRYYFSNGTVDGNGSFAGIHFNGTDLLTVSDTKGPEIRLYLENEKFKDGGSVSPNPLLMVYLSDESGINTSGIGIGHDITLELDGEAADPLILNDFYRTDPGTWKSGTIFYPLSTLSKGLHSLKLKVWDSANNSSYVTVQFVVTEDLAFSSVSNYPNPFSDQTRFVITHNRYNELFDVNLEIMDLSGREVFSDRQRLVSNGYQIDNLYWDPKQSNPIPENGVYLYRITLTDKEGYHVSQSGRMIWRK